MSGELRPVRPSRYIARCGICDEPVYDDDDTRIIDGEVCHAGCVEDEVYSRDEAEDYPL